MVAAAFLLALLFLIVCIVVDHFADLGKAKQ